MNILEEENRSTERTGPRFNGWTRYPMAAGYELRTQAEVDLVGRIDERIRTGKTFGLPALRRDNMVSLFLGRLRGEGGDRNHGKDLV